MNRVIKNTKEHEQTLETLEKLLDEVPAADTPEGEQVEILTLLVEDYESKRYKIDYPTPIEAIKFRMDQQRLIQRDLIPYIGSRSKVSEVLAGKRSLTLSMIRALHSGLGIPAEVLIQDSGINDKLDWFRFPIKQMISLKWIDVLGIAPAKEPEKLLRPFFERVGYLQPKAILLRSASHIRSARPMDKYALMAWSARVLYKASTKAVNRKYEPGSLTEEILTELKQLSVSDKGPKLAIDFLADNGIQLVIERHLARTNLDGAILMTNRDNPIIAMTVRYDRVDNFWFTLFHELAHLILHLESENNTFYDDLDIEDEEDIFEAEANELAAEMLIPHESWIKSPASRLRSPQAAEYLAKQLNIHPAIVAGKIRHEFKAFQLLSNLVGKGQVRKLFTDVYWRISKSV